MSQYDYVVVGGGSAGSVLASRLTEDEDTDVLLLDAGKDWRSDEAPPEIRSPNFFFCLFELEEEFMWPTMEATLTAEKEPERYYVGKGLGGGSTVNAQFFVHPPMEDFDQWEELGADGWSGDDVSGYFREMERDGAFGDRPYHGDDGPIPVWRREREEWMAIDRALYDAATDLGHSESRDMDFNSPDKEGISMVPFNVEDGERVSTNDAYIEPVRGRDNLTIQGETLVDTVLFDGREAVGVEALGPDQRRRTYVADEVILSAGAVQTPGILMRSGIGPESQLADIDVGVKIDHPGIGRLIDHPLLSLSYDLTEEYQADPPAPDDFYSSLLLAWSSGTSYARDAELQIHPQNFVGTTEDAVEAGGMVFGLMDIYSRGRLKVTSRDPTAMPDIFVNMLGDRRDLVRARQGIRHVFELSQHEAFQEIVEGEPTFAPRGAEGEPISTFEGDDEALEAEIRKQCQQYFHPVGTCRMGDPNDEMAVVDPDCRVIGTEDLYVADASIMPDIVRTNTNSTCIMIGEYLADKLRR